MMKHESYTCDICGADCGYSAPVFFVGGGRQLRFITTAQIDGLQRATRTDASDICKGCRDAVTALLRERMPLDQYATPQPGETWRFSNGGAWTERVIDKQGRYPKTMYRERVK